MAIRRGTKVPESATEVFAVATRDSTKPAYDSGFPVDMAIRVNGKTGAHTTNISARLTQKRLMNTDETSAEQDGNEYMFDYMDGWNNNAANDTNSISWMWKRAPGYFDVVAYSGNSTAGRTVSHNLGVAPEMMWVKGRTGYTANWIVYHSGLNVNGDNAPETDFIRLDEDRGAFDDGGAFWNSTAPTDSNFTVGSSVGVNGSSGTYIAYLFASLDGISKVGSYTGDGTTDGSKVIDCGFTSGARFVLIKPSSYVDSWFVFDSERGITVGTDPRLKLDTTDAEASYDLIDPASSGFTPSTGTGNLNQNGETYIFYAIA
jgi:hypothetical protein